MRIQTVEEVHECLRGGKGTVTTYTTALKKWIICGRISPTLKAIKLVFEPNASVGWHKHTDDSENYITFNRNIRFVRKSYWTPINICLKGHSHSARNIGNTPANVYAMKF